MFLEFVKVRLPFGFILFRSPWVSLENLPLLFRDRLNDLTSIGFGGCSYSNFVVELNPLLYHHSPFVTSFLRDFILACFDPRPSFTS